MRTLEGKTALVTGGGSGVGRAIALALSARGVRVVVTGRDEKALGETVGEIAHGGGKGRHLAGDVRDRAHLASAADRAIEVFGGLDIVIANTNPSGLPDQGGGLEGAEAIFQTNLMGVYYTFDVAISRLKDSGRLIATSCPAEPGGPGHVASSASDAGVLGLCRALAHELAPKKITCNSVVAGAVEPEEVAQLVVFLCGAAADGITGQALAIGGRTQAGSEAEKRAKPKG